MKQFCIVLLFGAISAIASAQECSNKLSGIITDFHDGTPLFGALVQVIGTNAEVYTDFDGNYTITNLCNGNVELQVSHPDCQSIIQSVEIKGNTVKNIKLEHHLEEIGEVIVSGNTIVNKTNSATESTIDSDVINNYSSSNLGTALKEITGVSSLNTGNTIVKPVINGMHSNRVLIINNGVRLQDQEWGVEHAPNFDINSADKITVVKGAAALRYGGDAIGGTIIIDGTKPILADSLYGKTILSGSSNGRGGSITSSLIKTYKSGWYAKAQGTFKYFGDYQAPDYVLSNTGNREKDFSLGFGLRKVAYGFNTYYSFYNTQIGILRASHIGSVQDLVNALDSNTPTVINNFTYNINAPYQDVTHHLLKTDYYKRFSSLGKLTLQYSFQQNQRKEYDIRRGDDKNTPAMDMVLDTHTFNADFDLDAFKNYKISFGIVGGYQTNTPNPDTGVRRLIPDYQQTNAGLYLTAEHKIGDNTIVDAGLRYDYTHIDAKKYYLKSRWEERGYDEDYHNLIIGDYTTQWLTNPVFSYNNPSATLGVKHFLNNNYTVNANFSLASRAPNASELFSDGLHHSAAIIELGDLRMKQEVSKKLSLGFTKSAGNLTFGVNPYVNFVQDFIMLQPTGIEQTTRGAFPVWEYSQANVMFAGVDADLGYEISNNLKYNTGFAYVYAQDTEAKRPVIDIPAARWNNGINFTYPKWNKLKLGLKSETVFTQTRYPNNDFETSVTTTEGTETVTVALSKPPKGYELLHFNSQITLPAFNKSNITIGFNIQNILNTKYRDYLNRQRYYADAIGRNFNLQLTLAY